MKDVDANICIYDAYLCLKRYVHYKELVKAAVTLRGEEMEKTITSLVVFFKKADRAECCC